MTSLEKSLRNQMERTVKDARDAAEAAARSTIDHLGVGEASAPAYLSAEERELRKRLRIHGHQLGDQRESKSTNPAVGKQDTDRLVEEVAYGHWHRMLFARFLAENNRLLKEAGYAGKTLETWLRDGFFAQHCELFHQRPFIWQIWDGLRDGFSTRVN